MKILSDTAVTKAEVVALRRALNQQRWLTWLALGLSLAHLAWTLLG